MEENRNCGRKNWADVIVGIELVDDNLLHWKLRVQGPRDTPYEAGVFVLDMAFPSLPVHPPKCHWDTKLFHPNVDFTTGEICCSMLGHGPLGWVPGFSPEAIALSLYVLLDNPNVEDPVNPEVRKASLLRSFSFILTYDYVFSGC